MNTPDRLVGEAAFMAFPARLLRRAYLPLWRRQRRVPPVNTRNRLRRFVATAAVAAAALIPSTAWAHANLDRADPAPGTQLDQPPPQLQLFFSEAVDGSFSRVQLLNAQRETVDRGDSHIGPNDPRSMVVSLPAQLPNGVYTVSWRTLSAVDGHRVDGAYPLIVGPMPAEGVAVPATAAASQATFEPETALGRWWFYVAASAFFGVLLSWQLVYTPLFGRSNPSAQAMSASRSRRMAMIAGVALLVGTLYVAVAQASNSAAVPIWGAFGQPLIDLLSRGRFAALWWSRLALVVVALGLVSWQGVRSWPGRAALGVMSLALLTSSLNSHGAALLSGAYLGVAVDWVHLTAVAAWIGGLLSLVFVLPVAVSASQASGGRVRAQAITRFSNLALVSVAVIIATGTFQAWLEVGAWEGLIQTAYGLSVTAKIALLALMLVLGAFNLLIVRPRTASGGASGVVAARAGAGASSAQAEVAGPGLRARAAAPATHAKDAESGTRADATAPASRADDAASALARRFTGAVRGEAALGMVVLVVAAILTGLSPARDELARRANGELQGGPVDRQENVGGLSARIQISPAVLGINRLSVELPGTDPSQVERVQLTFTYLDAQLGSQPVVLPQSSSSPDTWETSSPLLSQAGTWQAEMLVRRTGQDDARTAIRFVVVALGGAPETASASSAYPLLPSPMISLAYLLIALGVGVAIFAVVRAVRQPRRRRAFQRQAAMVGAGLVILACGGYVYAAENRNGVPLDVANIRDPIPPDERSLAIGKDVYTTDCETCHGETGRGDGPSGLRLVPRPADLRIHMAPGVHTDGELFYWVSYGFQGSAMPAWKELGLTDEQIWSVINYGRAQFGNPGQ